MAMIGVDGSRLLADSQLKLVELVWGLVGVSVSGHLWCYSRKFIRQFLCI